MRFCAELSPGFGGHSAMGTSISAYLRMELRDRLLPYTYFRPNGVQGPLDDLPDEDTPEHGELFVDLEVQEDQ